MEENARKQPKPPYLSYKTLTNFISGFKAAGLPDRIDRTVMSGQSGATQSNLIQSLLFFNLIAEDGTPSTELAKLVETEMGDSTLLKQLITTGYSFVFTSDLNLETATDGQLQEVFRTAGLGGDTTRKAMTFFVQIAEAAGLKISPHIKSAKKSGNGGSSSPRPRKRRTQASSATAADVGGSAAIATPPGYKPNVLHLNVEGTRTVTVTAPLDLTKKEIKRLKTWLGVTLLVEDWDEEGDA